MCRVTASNKVSAKLNSCVLSPTRGSLRIVLTLSLCEYTPAHPSKDQSAPSLTKDLSVCVYVCSTSSLDEHRVKQRCDLTTTRCRRPWTLLALKKWDLIREGAIWRTCESLCDCTERTCPGANPSKPLCLFFFFGSGSSWHNYWHSQHHKLLL